MLALSVQRLLAFRFTVAAAAAALVAALQVGPQAHIPGLLSAPLWGLGFFAALAALAELWVVHMPRYGPVTLADAVFFAAMVLYGPLATVVLVLVAGIVRFAREMRRKPLETTFVVYSVAQSVLSFGLAAWFYAQYAQPGAFLAGWTGLANLAVMAGAVVTCFLVQSALASMHKWLEQEVGIWGARVNWQRLKLFLQALAPLGLLMAIAFEVRPVAVLLLLGPLAVASFSLKRYTDTLREARLVIESLAEAVEKRDPLGGGHSLRVAAYAEEIARELRLDEAEVARVAAAGRLHDLGKISVTDEVLMKIDELTEEDYEEIKRHPEVGAQVALKLSLSRREAELIRHHHEWFDGSGYPDGLKGEEIPLGSRILGVAEAFDTMTTPRSYRGALSREEALARLQAGSGIQFDPRVVAALQAIARRKWGLSPGGPEPLATRQEDSP